MNGWLVTWLCFLPCHSYFPSSDHRPRHAPGGFAAQRRANSCASPGCPEAGWAEAGGSRRETLPCSLFWQQEDLVRKGWEKVFLSQSVTSDCEFCVCQRDSVKYHEGCVSMIKIVLNPSVLSSNQSSEMLTFSKWLRVSSINYLERYLLNCWIAIFQMNILLKQ